MKEHLESDEFLGRLAGLQVLAKKILRIESTSERADAAGSATAEFAAHRSYAAGDDTRYLDWNVYARLDELFVKRFKPEENVNFVVLLDSSASFAGEHLGKFRAAAQLAAALGYIGVSNFDTARLVAFDADGCREAARITSRSQFREFLSALAAVEPSGATSFEKAFAKPLKKDRGRSVAFILSDFLTGAGGEDFENGMKRLQIQRFAVAAVNIVSAGERRPRVSGEVSLVDAEGGASRRVVATPELQSAYETAFRAHLARVSAYFKRNGLPYIVCDPDRPFHETALRLLKAAGGFVR